MTQATPSIWDDAFKHPPVHTAPIQPQNPEYPQPHELDYRPEIPVTLPPQPQASNTLPPWAGQAPKWEPLPGKKLTLGSIGSIAVGALVAAGFNLGLPMSPGEGIQLAIGGVLALFADLRLKKMSKQNAA